MGHLAAVRAAYDRAVARLGNDRRVDRATARAAIDAADDALELAADPADRLSARARARDATALYAPFQELVDALPELPAVKLAPPKT